MSATLIALVGMEISKLGTVLKYSALALGETFPDLVGQARPSLDHLKEKQCPQSRK